MVDPDGIQIQRYDLSNTINIKDIPEFEFQIYNLDDDKDYDHFCKDAEKEVRKSFEYRAFIKYLRENMDMNKCSFLAGVSNEETFDIKIELHHYPFSLRDITEIVIRKRSYYNDPLELQMVAKEIMILHYQLLIGLIPLSQTVHELFHNGRLFIPVDRVLGRYNIFVDIYKPFCTPEQLETLTRIEKYSYENSNIQDTTIIEQNYINYNIQNDQYMLPEFSHITNNMIEQIRAIKDNNYLLPTINEKKESTHPIYFEKRAECPIEFFRKEDGMVA